MTLITMILIMYRLAVLLLLFCVPHAIYAEDAAPAGTAVVIGALENKAIDEASGLARSNLRQDLFWVLNDSGKPRLHAIDSSGATMGRANLRGAKNVDWEDMASFELEGKAYLLVADVGDNKNRREVVTLYVVEEPDLHEDTRPSLPIAWRIDFTYPDGARDVESVAVDSDQQRILLLSKRDIPAVLYELPLRPDSSDVRLAKRLGPIDSIPQPSEYETSIAAKKNNWYWQPTAMDISGDGKAAAILTYHAIHYFERNDDQDWAAALLSTPRSISIGKYPNAEALAFAADNWSIIVTTEKKNAPILHLDFSR